MALSRLMKSEFHAEITCTDKPGIYSMKLIFDKISIKALSGRSNESHNNSHYQKH